MLPINQVRTGQRWTPKLDVEPEAEVMQGHLRRQARPQARAGLRPLMLQTEGLQQAVVERLDDLADASMPAPQGLGPVARSATLRLGDDRGSVALRPVGVPGAALEACIHHVHPAGGRPDAGQARLWPVAGSQEGLRQALIFDAGRTTPIAGDRAQRRDGSQHVQALIPAHPGAAAAVGLPGQPAAAPPLGVVDGNAQAVEGFVGTGPPVQQVGQMLPARHDNVVVAAHQPVVLAAGGQRGKGSAQVSDEADLDRQAEEAYPELEETVTRDTAALPATVASAPAGTPIDRWSAPVEKLARRVEEGRSRQHQPGWCASACTTCRRAPTAG
jgi:hypothetical protein